MIKFEQISRKITGNAQNRRMHVLFLSYDGLTDPLGQSQILPYLLSLQGDDLLISIVSAEKQGPYEKNKSLIESLLKDKNIDWNPIKWTKSPPVISTVRDTNKMYKKVKEINRANPVDLIHCRGYISALAGMKAKVRKDIPFIFDIRGFFADERVEGGVWNLKNPVYKAVYSYFKKKEKKFFASADHIVSLTEKGKHIIQSKFEPKAEITVIPCAADFDHFDPERIEQTIQNRLRTNLEISESDYVISYLGSLGTWYQLDEMLDFFKEFLSVNQKARLLFITNEDEGLIQQAAERIQLPVDRLIITKSSRSEVPLHLSISDANLFFIKPCFSKQASSPTKMGEAMAMGIPLICNSGVGDVDSIVEETNAGITVDSSNPESFKPTSQRFLSMSFEKKQIREEARKFYDLDQAVDRYRKIYHSILINDDKTLP